jgi:GTP-binding protein
LANGAQLKVKCRVQSQLALDFADVIVFTVNAKEEITADDRKIIDMIRKKRRRHVPVIVALTKADTPGKEDALMLDYQELNIGDDMIALSAPHRIGTDELEELIVKHLKALHFGPVEKEDESVHVPRIAIIGRPNVGKSSIVNALMTDGQREKSPLLVSDIAGTTRDSTDTEVMYHGQRYVIVDTAGLKKNARRADDIERYSAMRTLTAVEGADIVILVLSAGEPPTQQDKRIASLAIESGKGLMILLNKIDLLKGQKRKDGIEFITDVLHFASKFVKVIPCSAITREGLVKLFDYVEAVQQSRVRRIPTGQLNRWFESTVHGQPLGEISKTKYLTQADEIPPTFVLFVRNPKAVQASQLRYLENQLRKTFGFDGTPIRFITKPTEKDDRSEPRRKLKR